MAKTDVARSRKAGAAEQSAERVNKILAFRTAGADPHGVNQLPLWPEQFRSLPNDIARSSLFTARDKRVARVHYKDEPLWHLQTGISVIYTGEELRTYDDELVWLQILHYARTVPVGHPVPFSVYNMCQQLDWGLNKENYIRVRSCLTRLKANEVRIDRGGVKGVAISLLGDYGYDGDPSNLKNPKIIAMLSPAIVTLFGGDRYTHVPWEKYRDLGPVARKLYDYAASHREPFPLDTRKFHSVCASTCKTESKWRQIVDTACDALEAAKLVKRAFRTEGKITIIR